MVKRTLSLCFLLLAGIILAGHAIIPHHHHITVSKVVESIVYHHHDNVPESPANHSHEHDGSKTGKFVLDQVVIFRSGVIRSAPVHAPGSLLNFDHSQPFVACLPYIHQSIIPESALFRRTDSQKPFTLFLGRDNQLRGPPAA
ncbi:MAG: hypothetical protein AB9834_01165 [Lentimicrobium sp.]